MVNFAHFDSGNSGLWDIPSDTIRVTTVWLHNGIFDIAASAWMDTNFSELRLKLFDSYSTLNLYSSCHLLRIFNV